MKKRICENCEYNVFCAGECDLTITGKIKIFNYTLDEFVTLVERLKKMGYTLNDIENMLVLE